ncbi:MAG TPA: hypothetical protein VFA60_12070 [Terriglobales bacterium]|nr:hypothetical protein [Terriglobales bacterium]
MASSSTAATPAVASPALVIFAAGLTCGVLDLTAAFVTAYLRAGVGPVRILKGIASGALGQAAFSGGWEIAALGAGFHFLIAFTAAAVFYFASRRLHFLTGRAVIWGIVYGVAVYLVMYWIVQPLSLLRRPAFNPTSHAIAIVTHMLCVGLPIALVVRSCSRR